MAHQGSYVGVVVVPRPISPSYRLEGGLDDLVLDEKLFSESTKLTVNLNLKIKKKTECCGIL